VIYSAAMSLDGYIADDKGGVDWLHAAMVKGESYGLPEFQKAIDGVLMGSRTFEQAVQMGARFGPSKPCWVFSQRSLRAPKGVQVTAAPPREIVATLSQSGVTTAWLMGGGALAGSFLEADLIDEVSLAIMPVVLGSGIPVFGRIGDTASLRLIESKTFKGGAIGLRYEARRARPRAKR
jgi:dihydrofolate reductase